MFGRSPKQCIGQNLEVLMSDIFAKDHAQYMVGYLELGKEVVLNRKRVIFGQHLQGHIFPSSIYVKMNPDLSDGITYLGLMRPI